MDLKSLIAQLVPPQREFIVRSGGRVRYLRIGRAGQVLALMLAALAVGWVAFASVRFASHGIVVAEREMRIAAAQATNRRLEKDIFALRTRLDAGARSLDESVETGEQLVARNAALRDEIARVEAERERLRNVRDERDRKIAALNGQLARGAANREGLRRQLAHAELRLAESKHKRDRLHEQIADAGTQASRLNATIDALTGERNDLANRLETTQAELAATVEDHQRIDREREDLNRRVALLSDRLEQFEVSQSDSINLLDERAGEGIETLERVLDIARVDVPRLLDRMTGEPASAGDGVGGPLVALADEPGANFGVKLAAVEQRLQRLQGLQELMKRLPFAAPLNEYRLTSGFGRRVDPFNGGLAMHPGLDFASTNKSSVHVTAPGVVTFVGWKGGFGKLVEVDHGLGIRTRYGHLSRIFVERGQVLEFREKVGLVGSTGRSTAPHLHYEVLVDGRQLDPANFLRAGQYVFKK